MKDLHYHDYDQVFGMPLTELYLMTETHDKNKLVDLFLYQTSKAFESKDIIQAEQAFNRFRFVDDLNQRRRVKGR